MLKTHSDAARVLLSVSILISCATCTLAVVSCQKNMPSEYREFFGLPTELQRERLKTFPIDKQIEYHLAGHKYFHPPISFRDIIASQGKKAVPHLTKSLREERQEYEQVILIYVFRYMHRFHYNLKNEDEVIMLLKEVIADMKSPSHKKNAEEALKDIQEDRPPGIERYGS